MQWGGYFLTESRPTNFPTFASRRLLLPGESPTDYREVTEAERTALEAKAAAWVRPPQAFIDMWNRACIVYGNRQHGRYNEATGYFELNGIVDITYTEAMRIYQLTSSPWVDCGYAMADIRTNIYPFFKNKRWHAGWSEGAAPKSLFYDSQIEVARIGYVDSDTFVADHAGTFYRCQKLRKVIGVAQCISQTKMMKLDKCYVLEDIRINRLNTGLNAPDSPLLNLESWQYVVANAGTSGQTFTVHPAVYAKLTGGGDGSLSDDEVAAWEAVFTTATMEKNITFASA